MVASLRASESAFRRLGSLVHHCCVGRVARRDGAPMNRIADDPRIDPRLKVMLANLPTTTRATSRVAISSWRRSTAPTPSPSASR